MSYILKISYQHRHKKYRYNCDKPVNFNQIRTELAINHPPHRLLYHLQSADFAFSAQSAVKGTESLVFSEQELPNYLKNLNLPLKQMLKIRVAFQE